MSISSIFNGCAQILNNREFSIYKGIAACTDFDINQLKSFAQIELDKHPVRTIKPQKRQPNIGQNKTRSTSAYQLFSKDAYQSSHDKLVNLESIFEFLGPVKADGTVKTIVVDPASFVDGKVPHTLIFQYTSFMWRTATDEVKKEYKQKAAQIKAEKNNKSEEPLDFEEGPLDIEPPIRIKKSKKDKEVIEEEVIQKSEEPLDFEEEVNQKPLDIEPPIRIKKSKKDKKVEVLEIEEKEVFGKPLEVEDEPSLKSKKNRKSKKSVE